MAVRELGVEEEFLLLDPRTGHVRASADAVLASAGRSEGAFEQELLAAQVESGTPVCSTLADVRRELGRLRTTLAAAAAHRQARLAAVAAAPVGSGDEQPVTASSRYRQMAEVFGPVAREQVVCGCHVHVSVADPELAIQVINHARPWLPLLLAVSANSPYWRGVDTGYASYRSVLWSRWPTAGPPGVFADRADYDATVDGLLATEVLRDRGMIYWDARPSETFPTVEFRVADVCLEIDDAVLLAALARGLASTCAAAAARDDPVPSLRPEQQRGAHWRAARFGLTDELVQPGSGGLAPARAVLQAFLDYTRAALDEHGDTAEVAALLEPLLLAGTGAERQRAAYARRGDMSDVLELVSVPVEVSS